MLVLSCINSVQFTFNRTRFGPGHYSIQDSFDIMHTGLASIAFRIRSADLAKGNKTRVIDFTLTAIDNNVCKCYAVVLRELSS